MEEASFILGGFDNNDNHNNGDRGGGGAGASRFSGRRINFGSRRITDKSGGIPIGTTGTDTRTDQILERLHLVETKVTGWIGSQPLVYELLTKYSQLEAKVEELQKEVVGLRQSVNVPGLTGLDLSLPLEVSVSVNTNDDPDCIRDEVAAAIKKHPRIHNLQNSRTMIDEVEQPNISDSDSSSGSELANLLSKSPDRNQEDESGQSGGRRRDKGAQFYTVNQWPGFSIKKEVISNSVVQKVPARTQCPNQIRFGRRIVCPPSRSFVPGHPRGISSQVQRMVSPIRTRTPTSPPSPSTSSSSAHISCVPQNQRNTSVQSAQSHPHTTTMPLQLSTHKLKVHKGKWRTNKAPARIPCPECGKPVIKSLLQRHMRTHTGERPFACPHCSQAFSDRRNLKNHEYIHTGMPHGCEECGKRFPTPYRLKMHKRQRHADEADSGDFESGESGLVDTSTSVKQQYPGWILQAYKI